jgi:hypothetical protein
MEFTTTLISHGGTTTGLDVPEDLVAALGGGKKPKVYVTINGYTYRSSVAVMGGKFLVGVSAEHRAGAGVAAGDTVTVDLRLDTDPRVVEVPADLAAALAEHPELRAKFDKLSYSHQRQHVLAVEGAKAADTRARRVAGVITHLQQP